MIHALVASMAIGLTAGFLGCFVVWRRVAYFGDALAHSSLLGIVASILLNISPHLGSIIYCCLFAYLLMRIESKSRLSTDALLGVFAHTALSLGIMLVCLFNCRSYFQFSTLFFGDILTVSSDDLIRIGIICSAVMFILYKIRKSLLISTLHEEIAIAEGVNVQLNNFVFMFLLSLTVVVSIQIIGILLIASLLVIPAATARNIASSPKRMILMSMFFAVSASILGLYASLKLDTPAGPSIVTFCSILFILTYLTSKLFKLKI